ncbi:MAG: tripartite tricarboxylate transporter TctB family protein [Pseudomonadota bacterium]
MRSGRMAEFAAPVFFFLLGAIMLMLALTQPAWIEGRIGPGLFARWLSVAVMGMSLVWLAVATIQDRLRPPAIAAETGYGQWRAGAGLLAAVATFAFSLPFLGLVISCALTACVASWGSEERTVGAFALSAGAGAMAALLLGLTLLPPGTRLWPSGF